MSIAVVRWTSSVVPCTATHRLTEVASTTPAIAALILTLLVAKPVASPAPNLSRCWLYSHHADRSECDGSCDGLSEQFHDEERCCGVVRLTSPSRSGIKEVIPKTNHVLQKHWYNWLLLRALRLDPSHHSAGMRPRHKGHASLRSRVL